MIPAMVPSQTRFCALCPKPASGDPHHVIHRSMGGGDDDDNLVLLCSECHANAHPEKQGTGWEVDFDIDEWGRFLYAKDRKGHLIAKRYETPKHFDQARLLSFLERGTMALERLSQRFRYLDADGIEQVAGALGKLDHTVNWQCIGRLVDACHYRTPYGSRAEAMDQLFKAVGVKSTKGYMYRQAMREMEAHPELFRSMENWVEPQPGHILAVVAAPDKQAAVELLIDRLAVNPFYPVATLTAEIKAGAASMDAPPQRIKCVCHCGNEHWRDV